MTVKEAINILSQFDEDQELFVSVRKSYSRPYSYGFSSIEFIGKDLDFMDKNTWVDDDNCGHRCLTPNGRIIISGQTYF